MDNQDIANRINKILLEQCEDLSIVRIEDRLMLSFEHNGADLIISQNNWTDPQDICPVEVSRLTPFPVCYITNGCDIIQPAFELYNALLKSGEATHLAYYFNSGDGPMQIWGIAITVSFDNLQTTYEIQIEGDYS